MPSVTIATTRDRQPRPFTHAIQDRHFHCYLIGKTGVGKSTLLQQFITQDARSGTSFCLIDPHGDLAETARALAPTALYWDLAEPDCALGYNPLTPVTGAFRPLVASGVIETLKTQWSDAWGARMEHLLRYAVLALLEQASASIADIMPLFLDKEFRKVVVAKITDEQVRDFWTREFDAMRYKGAVDGVAPIANKISGFLAHPLVRQAVCKPKVPVRFRRIMDDGQSLIVNLAKGRLGSDVSNLPGGLVVNGIANAAFTRQSQPMFKRRPFFLYIDEFHNFTTEALAGMLSELRKFKVGLILAHQHTSQLEPRLLDAILGNVATLLVFRVGANDAEILARQLAADIPRPRDLSNSAAARCSSN
ncbi:MAG: hypothetical protein AAFN27_10465 [Pseudomonadota bacterium]